jgi:hypothetical protein
VRSSVGPMSSQRCEAAIDALGDGGAAYPLLLSSLATLARVSAVL